MSVIEVQNLTKIYSVHQKEPGLVGTFKSLFHRKYEKIRAVDNVSFNINEGELVGFIGPNGAGKTTTLKILSGLLYPTIGEVTVAGFVPWQRKPQFQKQFAFVAGQKNQLWWDLPAYETFLLNKEIYEVSDKDFRQRIDYLAKMLNISDFLNTQVKKLSLGQRMKAELIAALIHQPKILFLDEPTIGLDVVAQNNMRNFIKNYNQKFNATIILTSHYMGDVEQLSKRVIIIDKGKIIYDGRLAGIADKFSKHKIISLDFGKEIVRDRLKKFGAIVSYESSAVKIRVPRAKVAQTTAEFLDNFPVVDLSVEEPSIEEIIRVIFAKSK